MPQISHDGLLRLGVIVDQGNVTSATARSFNAKTTATRADINHRPIITALTQPIKHTLFDPVHEGAGVFAGGASILRPFHVPPITRMTKAPLDRNDDTRP